MLSPWILRCIVITLSFLATAFPCLQVVAADSAVSLTLSKVALPIEPGDKPFCITLREDARLMAFQMNRPGGYGKLDIWFSRFENNGWSKPYNAGAAINTSANEADVKFSADGSALVFVRSDDFQKSSQLYVSQFRSGSWTKAEMIGPPVSLPSTVEFGTVLSKDGRRLYFSSNREGGFGGQDFYYCERIGDGWLKWGEPVNLGPAVNTKENEVDLAVSSDEQMIIYPARKEDSIAGSVDLYRTRKVDNRWTKPENMGPRINTPGTDNCPWLGFDGLTLYLSTDWESLIPGNKGTSAFWVFRHSGGFR